MLRMAIGLASVALWSAGHMVVSAHAADAGAKLAPLRIVRVGDSSVASYAKPPADRPSLSG